jgi:hypothetical protein
MKRWAILIVTCAMPLSSPMACGGDGCLRHTDCNSGQVCRAGKCMLENPPPIAAGGEGGDESNPSAGTAGSAAAAGTAGSGGTSGSGGSSGSAGTENIAGEPSHAGMSSGGEPAEEPGQSGAGGEANAGAPAGGIGGAL